MIIHFQIMIVHSSLYQKHIPWLLIIQDNKKNKDTPRLGFEPKSKPRQGFMIGRYTTGAEMFYVRGGKILLFLNLFLSFRCQRGPGPSTVSRYELRAYGT